MALLSRLIVGLVSIAIFHLAHGQTVSATRPLAPENSAN